MLALCLAAAAWSLLAASASAQSSDLRFDNQGWFLLPDVPELRQTFSAGEGGGIAALCHQGVRDEGVEVPEIMRNPAAAILDCWSSYVDEAAKRRHRAQKGPRKGKREFACVPRWEVEEKEDEDEDRCPWDQEGLCARPALKAGTFGSEVLDEEPAELLGKDIRELSSLAGELAEDYTAFEYLRRGYSENNYNMQLAGLMVKQGLLVLLQAQRMLRLGDDLGELDCGTEHLEHFFTFAGETAQFVSTALNRVLEKYPPPNDPWARKLYELQIAVLGGLSNLRESSRWSQICKQAETTEGNLDGWDADLDAWCGYAFYRLGNETRSREAMTRAVQSPNHPDMSSYASWAIRSLLEK
jgi:hypothetical protein